MRAVVAVTVMHVLLFVLHVCECASLHLPCPSNDTDTVRFMGQTNGHHSGTQLSRGMRSRLKGEQQLLILTSTYVIFLNAFIYGNHIKFIYLSMFANFHV